VAPAPDVPVVIPPGPTLVPALGGPVVIPGATVVPPISGVAGPTVVVPDGGIIVVCSSIDVDEPPLGGCVIPGVVVFSPVGVVVPHVLNALLSNTLPGGKYSIRIDLIPDPGAILTCVSMLERNPAVRRSIVHETFVSPLGGTLGNQPTGGR
jgi:hypothetical protein